MVISGTLENALISFVSLFDHRCNFVYMLDEGCFIQEVQEIVGVGQFFKTSALKF
jgi:hypothetical protein